MGIVVLLGLGAGLIVALLPAFTKRAQLPSSSPVPSLPSLLPSPIPPTVSTPLPDTAFLPDSGLRSLNVGSRIQFQQPSQQPSPVPGVTQTPESNLELPKLLSSPLPPLPLGSSTPANLPKAVPQTLGVVPVGSILEVLRMGGTTQQDRWVQLRICSTPAGTSPESSAQPSDPASSPGEAGINPAVSRQIDDSASPIVTTSPGFFLQPGQVGWIREKDVLPLVRLIQNSLEVQGACASPTTLNLPNLGNLRPSHMANNGSAS
ncbi:MAG: hypothetical protein HC772_01710 [Leptolyngbyaceae cyanobacterium CRU_2_3]|nr:hypothetical protein [Leptolyngbyaceae cyanobacterium CRU_2_3]